MSSDSTSLKIGYIIRFYRRERCLSQMELAGLLGVSHRNLQRLEVGEVEPKLETIKKLSAFFKIPVSYLIRESHKENLFIEEASCDATGIAHTGSLFKDREFAKVILHAHGKENIYDPEMTAVIEGTEITPSPKLAELTGMSSLKKNVDNYKLCGSTVERWEFIARSHYKKVVMKDLYTFPKGFKVFESFHPHMISNPDNPRTEFFVRDITDQLDLERWILHFQIFADRIK